MTYNTICMENWCFIKEHAFSDYFSNYYLFISGLFNRNLNIHCQICCHGKVKIFFNNNNKQKISRLMKTS